MVKGSAGFVIPFRGNIVYIIIQSGDLFGEIDIFNSAIQCDISLDELVENFKVTNWLVRNFTVQSLKESILLSLPLKGIERMYQQFQDQFRLLFHNQVLGLQRILNLQLNCLNNIMYKEYRLTEKDFFVETYEALPKEV